MWRCLRWFKYPVSYQNLAATSAYKILTSSNTWPTFTNWLLATCWKCRCFFLILFLPYPSPEISHKLGVLLDQNLGFRCAQLEYVCFLMLLGDRAWKFLHVYRQLHSPTYTYTFIHTYVCRCMYSRIYAHILEIISSHKNSSNSSLPQWATP